MTYTKKPTKFILTEELIENDLRSHLKRVLNDYIFLCILTFILCLLVSLGLPYIAREALPIQTVILVIITYTPFPLCLSAFIYHLIERKKLLQGEYEINLSPLIDKKAYGGKYTQWFLYFAGFRRKEVEYPRFAHASPGDMYYIVHCKNSKCIRLVYHTKAYELKENVFLNISDS